MFLVTCRLNHACKPNVEWGFDHSTDKVFFFLTATTDKVFGACVTKKQPQTYMHMHTYIHPYVHPSIHLYIHTNIHTYTYTYTYIHTYVYVHTYICVCMYGWMDGWMYVCMHACMHACRQACMHAGQQKHTHTHVCHMSIFSFFINTHITTKHNINIHNPYKQYFQLIISPPAATISSANCVKPLLSRSSYYYRYCY